MRSFDGAFIGATRNNFFFLSLSKISLTAFPNSFKLFKYLGNFCILPKSIVYIIQPTHYHIIVILQNLFIIIQVTQLIFSPAFHKIESEIIIVLFLILNLVSALFVLHFWGLPFMNCVTLVTFIWLTPAEHFYSSSGVGLFMLNVQLSWDD